MNRHHAIAGRSALVAALTLSATLLGSGRSPAGIIVQQTTDTDLIRSALGGDVSIDDVRLTGGAASQFGIYRDFSLIGDGVVLSSGNAVDTMGPPSADDVPATDLDQPGTAEFDAYGPGHIDNFTASFDVARLEVDFTLDEPSAVAFSFIFGSIEYPNWVSNFTDSFLVFLDGLEPSQQITFDSNHVPVQVGKSFSDKIVLDNAETAFGDPHGFIPRLRTTTPLLAAGPHTLYFEVGDVNDHILDSAVFLTNLRLSEPRDGDDESDTEFEGIPEPSSLALLGLGLAVAARAHASAARRTSRSTTLIDA